MTDAPAMDVKAVARLLMDDATFGIVLFTICARHYPDDLFEVDQLELCLRLEEDFGVRLSEANENKLKAMLVAVSTDLFYTDPEVFASIANTLIYGDPGLSLPDLPWMDPVTLTEAIWAIQEVNLAHGEDELAPAVQSFLSEVVSREADEGGEEPSVDSAVRELTERLAEQLSSLGIEPPEDLHFDLPSPAPA